MYALGLGGEVTSLEKVRTKQLKNSLNGNMSNKIMKRIEYFIDKLRSHQDDFRNSLLLHNFDFSSVV